MVIRNQPKRDLEEDHSRLKKSQHGKEPEKVLGIKERAVWCDVGDDGEMGKK